MPEIDRKEIVGGMLARSCIEPGDSVYVASDTRRLMLHFARKEGSLDAGGVLKAVLDALLELVGPEGTVAIPVFNWDFCSGKPFDYHASESKVGALGNAALAHPAFRRTRHPFYGFAVAGADQDLLCSSDNMDAFGSESAFAYFHRKRGKFLTIDVTLDRSGTFLHYVEQSNREHVPYRFLKTFTAPYIDERGIESVRSASMFVRYYELDSDCLERLSEFPSKHNVVIADYASSGCHMVTYDFGSLYDEISHDILENDCRDICVWNGQGSWPCKKDGELLDGQGMHDLVRELFPLCRSITGNGVRETLSAIRKHVPEFAVREVSSGTQVFDWTVPDEWNVREAYIETESGERIADFSESNLHLMGYSVPVDEWTDLDGLIDHVYVQDDRPDAIPYVTSYYAPRFGFCMSKNQRDSLPEGRYRMYVDSTLEPGSLTYAELLVPSTEGCYEEVMFTTYCCHPSMANNELSGPAVMTALIQHVQRMENRHYTYRFVIAPETIGSITYLSTKLAHLQEHVVAGFNLTCIGDERAYTYIETRAGNTLADRVAQNVLSGIDPSYRRYGFIEGRGSDERQYNAPGVDLPVCALCRTRFGDFPEYHTSDDDLGLVTPAGLQGGLDVCLGIVEALEGNRVYRATCLCEPQLGRRGLYPTVSKKGSYGEVRAMTDMIACADGTVDLIAISEKIGVPVIELLSTARRLEEAGLFEVIGYGGSPIGA